MDGTLRNGDFIVFDAPSNLGSDDSVNLTVNVNNTGNRNLIDREENRINETHLEASRGTSSNGTLLPTAF